MPDTPIDDPSLASEPVVDLSEGLGLPATVNETPPTSNQLPDLKVKVESIQALDQERRLARPRSAQIWASAMAAGGLAGFASWLIGEWFVDYRVPQAQQVIGANGPLMVTTPEELASAVATNATLAFGLMGVLMGALLGIAGGLIRWSSPAALKTGLVGLVLGLVFSVVATLASLFVYNRLMYRLDEGSLLGLFYALMTLGVIWAAIGAAGGISFGLGMGGRERVLRGLVGGLLGGLLGALLYQLVGAYAFPLDETTQPVSLSQESRLLARAFLALFASTGIATAVAPARPRKTLEQSA